MEIVIALIVAIIATTLILILNKIKQIKEQQQKEVDDILLRIKNNQIKRTFPKVESKPLPVKPKKTTPPVESTSRLVLSSREETKTTTSSNSDDGFLTSMMVAQATDSALLGMAIGGNPLGAMIGDSLNDSDSYHSSHDSFDDTSSSNHDSSPSYDSSDYSSSSDSTSYDSSSSYDSSDSSSTSSDW